MTEQAPAVRSGQVYSAISGHGASSLQTPVDDKHILRLDMCTCKIKVAAAWGNCRHLHLHFCSCSVHFEDGRWITYPHSISTSPTH